MCRFLAYKGHELSMADLLTRSEQSLIRQSFKAREREEPLNGDGFGVAWYARDIDPIPGVYSSVQPAWANRNLRSLAEKIRSDCFFAHVRAASPESPVNELNCHPFQFRQFLWMHNGKIGGFPAIKRALREQLKDEYYNLIEGTTDSEHAFALFLDRLGEKIERYDVGDLEQALRATIASIESCERQARITDISYFNFCLTDGHSVLATRYVSDPHAPAQTLYIAQGRRFELHEGHYRMIGPGARDAVIIASEPLTHDRDDWQAVPVNHLVRVSAGHEVEIEPL